MDHQRQPVVADDQVREFEQTAMQEPDIISGLRRGDRTAWTALYDMFSVRVWNYVARLVGPHTAIVADLVQETMLAAAQSAQKYDDARGTLWQWLTGIAHKHVLLYWRSQRRVTSTGQQLLSLDGDGQHDTWQPAGHPGTSPGDPIEQREQADLVRRALTQLPSDYTALLTARYIDELSIQQIRDQTGRTSDSVRSGIVRARREFRDVYERLTAELHTPKPMID